METKNYGKIFMQYGHKKYQITGKLQLYAPRIRGEINSNAAMIEGSSLINVCYKVMLMFCMNGWSLGHRKFWEIISVVLGKDDQLLIMYLC